MPVGSYLSGGLDSTILASLIAANREVPLRTFSVEFEDAEFDETAVPAGRGQRTSAPTTRRSSAVAPTSRSVFPDVVWHAEAPLLRTAPAPLFILARLVRGSGYRVVLTGEGADEFFAGYDLFREDRVRRFWARRPDSKIRPQLLRRLYPYLARSPVAQVAMAKAFFGKNLTADGRSVLLASAALGRHRAPQAPAVRRPARAPKARRSSACARSLPPELANAQRRWCARSSSRS